MPSSNPESQTSSPPLVLDLLQNAPGPTTAPPPPASAASLSLSAQQDQSFTLTPAHKASGSGVLPSFTQLFSAVQPQRTYSFLSPSPNSFRLNSFLTTHSFLEALDAEGSVNLAQEPLVGSGQPEAPSRTPAATATATGSATSTTMATNTTPPEALPVETTPTTTTTETMVSLRVQLVQGQLQVLPQTGIERAHSGTDTEEIVSDEELSGWAPVQKKPRTQ